MQPSSLNHLACTFICFSINIFLCFIAQKTLSAVSLGHGDVIGRILKFHMTQVEFHCEQKILLQVLQFKC